MNKNEGFLIVLNIENIFEEVFTRKGMGIFMRMAWLHIKDEYNKKDISDISYRLMIEELIVYGLATQDEKGYNKMLKVLEEKDKKLKIDSYKELMDYYKDYIKPLRNFFENNPDRKKKIFEV